MKVYIVEVGNETDMDYHVVSVHKNKQSAITKALQQPHPLGEEFVWIPEGSVENVWFGHHPLYAITVGYLEVSEFELEE